MKKVFSFVKKKNNNNENKKLIKLKNGKKINKKKVDLNVMRQTKTRWIWKLKANFEEHVFGYLWKKEKLINVF